MRRLFISVIILLASLTAIAEDQELFPLPDTLRPAVDFWVRVYTEVDSNAGYVHDSRKLNIVYETIHFKSHSNSRQQKTIVAKETQRYRNALNSLAAGKRENLSDDEKKILELWGASVSSKTLYSAAKRLRFQRGQADRLRDGIVRSGAWEKEILLELRDGGLPDVLALIPHVESSYNPSVRSPAGALGLWQFTRPTGLKYLRIDHIVDERLDPLISTVAAAELLKHNYKVLKTWPLAITAYNSGLSRVARAVREVGTKDIGIIIREYRGRRFGFASRNFYAAFLAVARIVENTDTFFGLLDRHPPEEYQIIEIPNYLEARVVAKSLSLELDVLKEMNPALLHTVWIGNKYIPKGYSLKLPSKINGDDSKAIKMRIAAIEAYKAQIPDTIYKVRKGDTLSAIAQRYSISVRDLVALNNLRSRHHIRAGQSLRLPRG